MQRFYTVWIAGLALLAAGCADPGAGGPQSRLLDADSLSAGKRIQEAAAKAGWPQADWWHQLHDAQLDQLVTAALAGNPGLRAAAARLRQAQALAGVAESATRPQAAGEASFTRQRYSEQDFIPPPEAGNYSWYNHAALNASYDLDLWGRQRAALSAALDEAQVLAAEAQLARLNLSAAVVRAYVQLALQYAEKDLLQDNLAQRERSWQLAKKRKAAGLAAEAEVVLLESRLPAARNQIEQVDEAIELLRNQLAALCGQGPAVGEALRRPTLKLDDAAPRLPSALPAELVGRRPDVSAQRWKVEAEARKIDAAKAAFYPNINLMAFAGFQAIGFDNFPSASTAVRGIGPAISLPIFEGGRLRSALSAQTAAYDAAVDSYNASVVRALNEVAGAIAKVESQAGQQKQTELALASAQKAFRLAQQGYRAGLSDQDNVIAARLALLAAQQQLARIRSERLDSFAALMSALGGGVAVSQPPAEGKPQ
ncbi:efflux transporter outer membrane subunit [Chromobacterium subtsugae]|uniref:Efflux transporter outer membrane subunit n=2 Tax=Chromobacterium subtsugae TaxID=251747 RepID=A0ABS7FDV8_9NEIS|nr:MULTISPECIES: efflux transporter outer membrane subunit [Chromobacterium]KZE87425.1 fusaric acid resistance protein [Chromobacterium sp. F49]MBW7566570.1 efflux transporter outer membrane subunit [Chromobacterium subtsugae]MBW8288257.1 efflux transporter outer membrane subunit [Chromobacterium subtsugae]WSE92152.1 efflux transporter outer membrane subunit [Chromobacterium subtsugae]WVH60526.1 efflux transporter outer membrane subunit [Chromobacterium subtsugae]